MAFPWCGAKPLTAMPDRRRASTGLREGGRVEKTARAESTLIRGQGRNYHYGRRPESSTNCLACPLFLGALALDGTGQILRAVVAGPPPPRFASRALPG